MLLDAWLRKIKSLHNLNMDLSLERVLTVGKRLNLLKPKCPVITVAGTNGKGSCVSGLEAIYLAAGYKVGAFTSPILFAYNEYVRVAGYNASDEDFCLAFRRIDEAREAITLTPFEFSALAAFEIFKQANLDIWILEVGLGGRFDAVNVIDADIAIVSSIGIDHVEWLGDTREKIGYEKAGIFRSEKPAIYGDFSPPESLINYAKKINADLYCQDKEFNYKASEVTWEWKSKRKILDNLPIPTLLLQNMSCVLMAIELLQEKLPITKEAINYGLKNLKLPGRLQIIAGPITHIFDVSHNPHAIAILASTLKNTKTSGKTRAVFSMLIDKDMKLSIEEIKDQIDEWYIAELNTERKTPLKNIFNIFKNLGIHNVVADATIQAVYQKALTSSLNGDRIVIFGSFHTVAEVMRMF